MFYLLMQNSTLARWNFLWNAILFYTAEQNVYYTIGIHAHNATPHAHNAVDDMHTMPYMACTQWSRRHAHNAVYGMHTMQ